MRANFTSARRIMTFAIGAGLLVVALVMIPQEHIATYRSEQPGLSFPPTTTTPDEKATMTYHALVIGINDYDSANGNDWDNLKTARQDAEAVADVLEKKYGFTVQRLLDHQATRSAIMAALDSCVAYSPNDSLLIYFAGHGFYDETISEGYWIPSDAPKTNRERYTKEDWVWNSTVTKILGASKARHILVIADACYSGSLFRGGEEKPMTADSKWYAKVFNKPSRYLITSGDMEPVLDSGAVHSIFAGELLEYLNDPPQSLFAASELGFALRQQVGPLTRQTVRMGPLPVASDEGGEFIFAADKEALSALAVEPAPATELALWKGDKQQALQDTVLLASQGATQSAQNMTEQLNKSYPNDPLVQNTSERIDEKRQRDRRESLSRLVKALDESKSETNTIARTDRPPIIASLFTSATDSSEQVALNLLCNALLDSELEKQGNLTLVERASLEEILQELHLSTTSLTQEELRLNVGKLLPASILLLGNVNNSHIFIRLVDTETSQILGSLVEPLTNGTDMLIACQNLADQIVEKLKK